MSDYEIVAVVGLMRPTYLTRNKRLVTFIERAVERYPHVANELPKYQRKMAA